MFLTYQLSMVEYWPTRAVTGPVGSYVLGDENHDFTLTVTDISLKRCVGADGSRVLTPCVVRDPRQSEDSAGKGGCCQSVSPRVTW